MPFSITADPLPIFPTDISFGRPGGPEYVTDVVILDSGHEQRNAFWPEPRYSWDVGYGVRTYDKIYALLQFFHACKGRKEAFRFKDWADYSTAAVDAITGEFAAVNYTDQSLGTATAGQTTFQLTKTYSQGSYTTAVDIIKPAGATVRIGVAGSEEVNGWTVSEITGQIVRGTPLAGGEAITWGGLFYRKCRFDVDKISASFYHWTSGEVEVPIIHVR